MSDTAGEEALGGKSEWISNKCFDIQEDMVMEFKGRSCNITDREGNPIPDGKIGPDDGTVTKKVSAGFRCYIMRAYVKFTKEEQ